MTNELITGPKVIVQSLMTRLKFGEDLGEQSGHLCLRQGQHTREKAKRTLFPNGRERTKEDARRVGLQDNSGSGNIQQGYSFSQALSRL
jgi:hypothetical protein